MMVTTSKDPFMSRSSFHTFLNRWRFLIAEGTVLLSPSGSSTPSSATAYRVHRPPSNGRLALEAARPPQAHARHQRRGDAGK